MKLATFLPSIIALTALLLAAPLSHAQSSEVFIQNAKTFGAGNTLYMYGLPVKNAVDGKVSYWDAQIVLEAAPDTGKPNKATFASVVKSPPLKKSEFVPGTYASGNATCSLVGSPFIGRTQFDFSCVNTSGLHYIGVWYTGPITGHPEEVRLRAAKLDQIPGSSEYSWGKTAYAGGASPWFGCFNEPELMALRQVGDTLTMINFGSDDVEDCRVQLIKQP